MSNVNTDGLPPEMQARIAQIIEGAKQKSVANTQPQAERDPALQAKARAAAGLPPEQPAAPLAPKVPNLMDHTICLLYTSPSPRDMRRSRMPSSA